MINWKVTKAVVDYVFAVVGVIGMAWLIAATIVAIAS